MVQSGFRRNIHDGTTGAGFRVERSEDQTWNTGQHNGTDAHGAGFQRDIERGLGEAPAFHLSGCFPDREQLRMRGWVLIGFTQIVGSGNDDPVADEQGGDRDFADQRRLSGESQCLLHERHIEVVVNGHGVVSDSSQRWSTSFCGEWHASMFAPGIAGDVCRGGGG